MEKGLIDNKDSGVLKDFFLGIVIFLVVQTIFMLGGLLIEKKLAVAITGIPSAIGLTIILIIGLTLFKSSKYYLLGSFTLAFLSPLILGLIVMFKAMAFSSPIVFYSLIYLICLILAIWSYFSYLILNKKL